MKKTNDPQLTLGSINICTDGTAAYVKGSSTLAGSATLLTEHVKILGSVDYLPLFYAIQSRLFSTELSTVKAVQKVANYRNIFDLKTLNFLELRSP